MRNHALVEPEWHTVEVQGGRRTRHRLACLPAHDALAERHQQVLEGLAGGIPVDRPWSHQTRVAEGELDACVWFAGDIWDHAAPSIIVEEAGGRFSDHMGGKRLDTRTAIYSNGLRHDEILSALRAPTAPSS